VLIAQEARPRRQAQEQDRQVPLPRLLPGGASPALSLSLARSAQHRELTLPVTGVRDGGQVGRRDSGPRPRRPLEPLPLPSLGTLSLPLPPMLTKPIAFLAVCRPASPHSPSRSASRRTRSSTRTARCTRAASRARRPGSRSSGPCRAGSTRPSMPTATTTASRPLEHLSSVRPSRFSSFLSSSHCVPAPLALSSRTHPLCRCSYPSSLCMCNESQLVVDIAPKRASERASARASPGLGRPISLGALVQLEVHGRYG